MRVPFVLYFSGNDGLWQEDHHNIRGKRTGKAECTSDLDGWSKKEETVAGEIFGSTGNGLFFFGLWMGLMLRGSGKEPIHCSGRLMDCLRHISAS